MQRIIRKAKPEDISLLMPVFDAAWDIMRQSGNLHQWVDGYPSAEVVRNDIVPNAWHTNVV